jgi:excisionase family DNA binding protein
MTQLSSISSGDELLSEAATAELLGVQPNTLAAWRSKGSQSLPFVRVGRLVRYRRQDVNAWLEARTIALGKPGEAA